MRTLVTGAAGFIGSHLAGALSAKGHFVRGLVMPHEDAAELESLGIEIFRGDLTDPASLAGAADTIDTVFHLAARTADWGRSNRFEAITVDGTRNLLKEAAGINRFVYCSSIAALGLGRSLAGLDEDAPRKKTFVPYCDTKIKAEDLVREFCSQKGMAHTIVRPANVIGPKSVWVKEVLDAFMKGPFPLIAGGRAPGAFVYVDNLVEGIILAGEAKIAEGRVYHFMDDYTLTWGEYLTRLGGWVGAAPFRGVGFRPAWLAGRLCEFFCTPFGIRPPMSRLAAGVMGMDNGVDAGRARKELGWKTRVGQEEAMDEIRTWVETAYRPPAKAPGKWFYNKCAVVTGGSSGIGFETAVRLAEKGAHLLLVARDKEKLERAAKAIASKRFSPHQKLLTLALDITRHREVEAQLPRAVGQLGGLDILINNAGVLETNRFEETSHGAFDAVMKTNVYGVRNLISTLLPRMRSGGHIVNISSGAGLMGIFGYTAYCASKYAVMGLSESLRIELKPRGIFVSVVCPPRVLTPMDEQEALSLPPETLAMKQMAGTLSPEVVAGELVRGIAKKRFMIIPGRMMKLQYIIQRCLGGPITRAVTDLIVRFV